MKQGEIEQLVTSPQNERLITCHVTGSGDGLMFGEAINEDGEIEAQQIERYGCRITLFHTDDGLKVAE